MKYGNLNVLEPSGPLQACNGTDLPFYLHFCEQSSSDSEQEHMTPPGTSCSPLSVATGVQRSAVRRHWYKGVLAGHLSNDQTGENRTVWGADNNVGVAAMSI